MWHEGRSGVSSRQRWGHAWVHHWGVACSELACDRQILHRDKTAQPDERRWRWRHSADLSFRPYPVFHTISCHLTQRIFLLQRIWKASRRLVSEVKLVHDSDLYKRTGKMHIMQTRRFVGRDNLSCLQIWDNVPIEYAAIPIGRNISGEHLPDESWTPPRLKKDLTDSSTLPSMMTSYEMQPGSKHCTFVFGQDTFKP